MSEFRTPARVVTDALRTECKSLLERCTTKQRAFFEKLFPGGIDAQPDERLKTAIGLCQRTIVKNQKAADAEEGRR